jgi:hypothetical protein
VINHYITSPPPKHTAINLCALFDKQSRMTTIASVCRLLADTDEKGWAISACETLESLTLPELKANDALRAQVRRLIDAAYDDPSFCHSYLSVANDVEQMLEEAKGKPSLLDKALAALGAKPYHPLARPPTPPPAPPVKLLPQAVVAIRPLPDPMDASTHARIMGSYKAPEKPTDHGCGYFDGAPWDICYACEYEKNPSAYEQKLRNSELVMLISAYFRNTRAGERVKGYSNETLESIVAFLNTPRAERPFTDAQVADKTFNDGSRLLAALRELSRPF